MKYLYLSIFTLFTTLDISARIVTAGPSDFRDSLAILLPGDTLYLIPGNYTLSLRIIDIQGTETDPIVIGGQPGMAKPIFLGNSCCNTVSLSTSRFLHLQDIVCDGQNIVGIDALKAEGNAGNWTHNIEISGFEIYNYGADQQNVGISTKCPSWNWWVHHNFIDAAGTGMYFGNSNGEKPFANSLIEYNLVQNTLGYNCQIKHQNPNTRDLSIGMPANGKTAIRYNVFSKESNASMGGLARPNLLVGNFPASGVGSNDYYEVYGNLFYQNPAEALFQGTGNVGFYNNILYNSSGGWGVAIQTHSGFQPRDIDVFHNTILIDGATGISISGANASFTQNVWVNGVFSPTPLSGGQQTENITAAFSSAGSFLNSSGLPLTVMDLTPSQNMMQTPGIDLSSFNKYERHDWDFDGKSRDGTYAGAYFKNLTYAWQLQLDFRDEIMQDIISSDTQIYLAGSSILILPCPANNLIQIEGLLGSYNIDILDVHGMVHQSLTSTNSIISIDIQALPTGVFFVSIKNKNNADLFIQKMIKGG